MAQWVNCLWNNTFVNPPPSPLLCEISKALLHLAQQGLTAGRQAGQAGYVAGWQTDEIQVNFENFRIHYS